LKEEQYRALCAACDEVLLAEDATETSIAIPWLHVIREHPVFLSQYAILGDSPGLISGTVKYVARYVTNTAGWAWQLARSLGSPGKYWYPSQDLDHLDILIVSHLINSGTAGNEVDFYFGHLPEILSKDDRSVGVVLLNHTRETSEKLAKKWAGSTTPRIVLGRSLSFISEVRLLKSLWSESRRLRRNTNKEAERLRRAVFARASDEAFSGDARTTLRMAHQFRALLKEYKPQAIISTFEGHAWERMLFWAAREVNPNIKRIAYQHAALFRYQHGIRRMLQPKYNPDYIFTSGSVARTQLQKSTKLPGTPPVYVLGSPRASGDQGTREAKNQYHPGQESRKSCLVIPEGIESECNLLFEFSIECAKENPEIHFIWRLHPIITFNSLAARNPKLSDLPSNIEISKASLEKDISRSRWALYRGTTAVVQAVMGGLQPIYYSLGEMTLDPLYELSVWRKSVSNVDGFSRIVNIDPYSDEHSRKIAQDYCSGFYEPIDTEELEKILV